MAWLSGWSCRKSITLSRASGAVTNYQMLLLVGESAGLGTVSCNGHIESDFDDLRFTKSDGTSLLDYWIESISGATPNQIATVWIEFDSIGTGATTFYMYYGKVTATAVSSGANTFLFFDNFDDASIDTAKWDILAGGIVVENGGYLKPGSAGLQDNAADSDSAWFTTSTCVEWRAAAHDGRRSMNIGSRTHQSWTKWAHIDVKTTEANFRLIRKETIETTTDSGIPKDADFHIWSIAKEAASAGLSFFHNRSLLARYTTQVSTTAHSVYLNNSGLGDYWWADWVFVRNYELTEPDWGSWGGEEGEENKGTGNFFQLF